MTAPALHPLHQPTSRVNSRWLVQSDNQAKLTLAQMRRYVRAALNNHDWVWFARSTLRGVDTRNPTAIANAVRDYVAERIQFAPDPAGIENITPPLEHMTQLQAADARNGTILGDCDDAATLAAALAGAVGVPSTFTIRAFDWGRGPSPYQHVFTTLHPRNGPAVDVDTTHDAQQLPPKVSREFTISV